jgi:hypothetical protein
VKGRLPKARMFDGSTAYTTEWTVPASPRSLVGSGWRKPSSVTSYYQKPSHLVAQASTSRSSVARSVTRRARPSTITSSPWSQWLQPVVGVAIRQGGGAHGHRLRADTASGVHSWQSGVLRSRTQLSSWPRTLAACQRQNPLPGGQ